VPGRSELHHVETGWATSHRQWICDLPQVIKQNDLLAIVFSTSSTILVELMVNRKITSGSGKPTARKDEAVVFNCGTPFNSYFPMKLRQQRILPHHLHHATRM
jgi:hypothetical protein